MKRIYRLENLDCAHCAAKMEKGIRKLDGVIAADINFLTQKLILEAEDPMFDQVYEEVIWLIHKAEPDVVVKRS